MHGRVAVSIAVQVSEVDVLKHLPCVALKGNWVVHRAVQRLIVCIVIEGGICFVNTYQHINVLPVAGDGAIAAPNAGGAPVGSANVIVFVFAAVAAGCQTKAHNQRQ